MEAMRKMFYAWVHGRGTLVASDPVRLVEAGLAALTAEGYELYGGRSKIGRWLEGPRDEDLYVIFAKTEERSVRVRHVRISTCVEVG